jgi:hypothetical protein
MEISLISWIEDIYGNKNVVNSCKVKKPEDISVDNFVDNIELILNRFIADQNNSNNLLTFHFSWR